MEQGFCLSVLKGPFSAQKGQGQAGQCHQNISEQFWLCAEQSSAFSGCPQAPAWGCVLSTPGTARPAPALLLSHTSSPPLLTPQTCQLTPQYCRACQAFSQLWNLSPQKHFVFFKIPILVFFFFFLFFPQQPTHSPMNLHRFQPSATGDLRCWLSPLPLAL